MRLINRSCEILSEIRSIVIVEHFVDCKLRKSRVRENFEIKDIRSIYFRSLSTCVVCSFFRVNYLVAMDDVNS